MNRVLSLAFLSFTFNYLIAQGIDVTSKVNEVTLYHSGALVNRSANLVLVAGPNELIFKNVSSKLLISTFKILDKEITVLNKTLVKKLSDEEINVLNDRKLALENQLVLLEKKYNEPQFIKDVIALEKMLAYYYERSIHVKKELRKVEGDLKNAALLEKIDLENENAAILRVTISAEKSFNKKVDLQYLVGSAGWSPGYEVSVANISDSKIEFKYLAKVINNCGENWTNVVVNLSSAFPLSSPTKLPKPEEIWILSPHRRPTQAQDKNIEDPLSLISEIEGVTYEDITIPTFIQTRTLSNKFSIKSNKTIFSFPIDQFSLPATYFYYAYPSIDPEAYLVARISNWDNLGLVDGYAYVSVNGDDVGTTYIKYTDFIDTLILPIGKDNAVFVNRKEKADETFAKESGNSKRFKENYAYTYEVKNNNSNAVILQLFDQVPISQAKSIEVDIEELSEGILNEELGEVMWEFSLKPGESSTKELRFEISTDSKGSFFRTTPPPQIHKYRTVKWL